MNIIKKIKNRNKDKNLIIYDNNSKKEFDKIINLYKLQNWCYSSLYVYQIYYGKAYNPAFFHNIISLQKNNLEDIQKIWNMTLMGGSIIISSHFKNYFQKSILYEDTNNSYILIKKNIFLTYSLPNKYRVIDFIIGGTMKGGTTSAMDNFYKHPEISMVKNEIHFFDKKEEYLKGIDWYKSHFDYSKKMIGDKGPDIMYMYSCLELVQMINPQIKIILFLRNPIERAYSHWKMIKYDLFKNNNILSFEDCVKDELQNRMGEIRSYNVSLVSHFIQRGFYYEQIKEILKYFPIDNLYISISEKIRDNMDEEYQKIFKFLGIKEFHSKFEEKYVSKNPEDVLDKKSKLYKDLQNLYTKDVRKLEKMIGYKTGWW